jgi:Zn-dependent peptidase ImmA (M78 family)
MPEVNADILKWARQTAGLSKSQAVARLRLGDARGVAALDRLRSLEEGATHPTRALLVKMAKQYRRPLLTFYLSVPPVRGDRGEDYRTLPAIHSEREEALLDALIRDVKARQGLIRSALLDEDDAHPIPFIGSVRMEEGVASVVAAIGSALGLSLDAFRRAADADQAFRLLREHAEKRGIFVLLLANLGSHHTNITLETFRGLSFADDIAPFVIINDLDHRGAWSFTLLHELTHLWLGQTGISGGNSDLIVEKFCNDVASEYLLPSAEVDQFRGKISSDLATAAAQISEFALARNISLSMVAYKLLRKGIIEVDRWRQLSGYFRARWLEARERQRARSRSEAGGPSYYVVRRHRLGDGLVGLTARLMGAGALTTSKAGRVLGVKPKNVQALLGHLA